MNKSTLASMETVQMF